MKKTAVRSMFRQFLCAALFFLLGCGNSEELKTIAGLQEKLRVLQGEIDNRDNRIEILTSDQSDQVAKLLDTHGKEIARLTSEISALKIEVGQKTELVLGYKEVIDSIEFSEAAVESNWKVAAFVLTTVLLLLSFLFIPILTKLRDLHNQAQEFVLKSVTRLRGDMFSNE